MAKNPTIIAKSRATYTTRPIADDEPIELEPEDDLISLHALSFAVQVDTTTIRNWLQQGTLQPDGHHISDNQSYYYFRRDRIEAIRQQFRLSEAPTTGEEWRQAFIDFNKSKSMRYTYKPVMIKAIFKLVDREGKVPMDRLVEEFRAFYQQRKQAGLSVELEHIETMSDSDIKTLIIKNPLDRFRIQQFIEYDADAGSVQIAPYLWQELRYHDIVDVLEHADEQIRYYYEKHEYNADLLFSNR